MPIENFFFPAQANDMPIESFFFSAQANEQFLTGEVHPPLQMGQEIQVGEATNSLMQPFNPELAEAVRLQYAQEFRDNLPMVEEPRNSHMALLVMVQTMNSQLVQVHQEFQQFRDCFQIMVEEAVKKCLQTSSSRVCWCNGATNLMEVNCFQDLMALCKSTIREEVEEVVKRLVLPHLQTSALPSTSRSLPHASSWQLHFVGTLPDTLLTLTNIQDEGASLTVELRNSSGSIVEVGPESSAKINIVVLDGDFEEDMDDWTQEDFNRNIVQQRKGKAPLLVGEYEVSLNKGVAVVGNISFTDNSKWLRSGQFRLGAQIIKGLPPGVVVREAVSKAFKVKERRLKSQQKLRTPSLDDYVWRLSNIGKNGPRCKRLEQEEVYTVQDFLKLYHTDPKKLQDIVQVAEKKWAEIVKNAESCTLNSDCYLYSNGEVNLLLDCVFNVVSVGFNGQNALPYGTLDDSRKNDIDKFRCTAYEKRNELQKTYYPANQISVQVGTICAPTHTNLQNVGAREAYQGEQVMQVNSCPPYHMQYSSQHEYCCQPEAPTDQMLELDPEEIFASLSPLLEDRSAILAATATEAAAAAAAPTATTKNVTSKFKAACYVTKAAIMFMISIQQDPSAQPRKKPKFR